MSYTLPTLQELLDRTRKSFRTYLPGSDAFIWPNNVYVSAKVIAGAVFEIFGFASYIARMIHVHTAPDIETLRRHGADYGIAQRPAYPSEGKILVTSTGDIAVSIGAIFTRTDGVQYVASASVSRVGAGTIEVPGSSMLDGQAGNAEEGTPLDITSGVTDVAGDATAEVATAFVGAADVEDMESYRARILFRKRNPPHGGAAADYVSWASEVAGVSVNPVTRRPEVFVERLWSGAGTVRVFPLMFDRYQDGIASVDDIARVAQHIDTLRPAGAIVTVAAPTAKVIDIEIDGFEPDSPAGREAVLASLREAFRRQGRVAGIETPNGAMPYLATPASFSLSWIWQAVANATGEDRHTIVSPTADIDLVPGEFPTLGNVTFS